MTRQEKEDLDKIAALSKHDQIRLMQCVLCPIWQGCERGDGCEDENGMCKDGPQIRRVLA